VISEISLSDFLKQRMSVNGARPTSKRLKIAWELFYPSYWFGSDADLPEDKDHITAHESEEITGLHSSEPIVQPNETALSVESATVESYGSNSNRGSPEKIINTTSPSPEKLFQNLRHIESSTLETTWKDYRDRPPSRSSNGNSMTDSVYGTQRSRTTSNMSSVYARSTASSVSKKRIPLRLTRDKHEKKRSEGRLKIFQHYAPLYEEATKAGFSSSMQDFEGVAKYMQQVMEFQKKEALETKPFDTKLASAPCKKILNEGKNDADFKVPVTPKRQPVSTEPETNWIRSLRIRIDKALNRFVQLM
jgi:hypothetical protein